MFWWGFLEIVSSLLKRYAQEDMVSASTSHGSVQMLWLQLQQSSYDCEQNKSEDKTDTLRMAEQKDGMKLVLEFFFEDTEDKTKQNPGAT